MTGSLGLRRRMWLLMVATLLGGVSALLVSSYQVPRYDARGVLVLEGSATDTLFVNTASRAKNVQTELQVLTSPEVSDAVRHRLGYNNVSVVADATPGTEVFSVIARAGDPSTAAAVANAHAEEYVGLRQRQAVEELESARGALQAKVNELQVEINRVVDEISAGVGNERLVREQNLGVRRNALISEQAMFKQQVDQLDVAAALRTPGVRILRAATPPTSPSVPATRRNIVLGMSSGVGLGLAYCLFRREAT